MCFRWVPNGLDMAVLKVKWQTRPDILPLELDDAKYEAELDIAAIGYPADDGRSGPQIT